MILTTRRQTDIPIVENIKSNSFNLDQNIVDYLKG
jgi:hypothetical protein